MKNPEKITKILFTCFERDSVNFKLNLKYDNLKQSKFFRSIIKFYIDKDPLMMQIVEHIKIEHSTMGKDKRNRARKDTDAGKKLLEDLGITSEDKENIFDMIERDLSDYE
tara:strand:+ start:3150 stop:3479 length:330 start_codon:yes stop_codon:yes gene_type:complete